MASRHWINGSDSNLLPVTGTVQYESKSLGADSSQYDIYMQFLDANKRPVTPTAGTVSVYGQPFEEMLLEASGSPLTASDVSTGVSKYTPPSITGLCEKITVKFTGVTGAQFAKVCIYKKG